MAIATIEERLKILEARQDALQQMIKDRLHRNGDGDKRGWQAIVGTFADDPLYDEAMRLGREWREAQRDADIEA